jgi:release factor glutamine methyltransferase
VAETEVVRRVGDVFSPRCREEGLPPLDLQVLLARAIGEEREYLFAHPERQLRVSERALFEGYVGRRRGGEPVAYITGVKEFYSLPFKVDRSVLIPRPETELLVDEVLDRRPARLLDLGTGSGNIAVAVKHHLPSCRVVACDASESAIALAKENARNILGAEGVEFLTGRFFEGLRPSGGASFDLIVSNPPYVKRGALRTLQREVREYEPLLALDGGEDGLDAYGSILGSAREFLAPGGRIVLEIDPAVLESLLPLADRAGFAVEKIAKDLRGLDRMAVFA